MNIFWGNEDLKMIFLGGHHKIGLVLGVFYAFEDPVLRSTYRMGIILEVAKISNAFFVFLIFLIFIFLQTVDAGSKPTYEEK